MTPSTINILLVDDSEDDIFLMRRALRKTQYVKILETACDGDVALDYLRQQVKGNKAAMLSLVVLDINMPRLDGFAVLVAIKTDPSLRHLPVIMLSTSSHDVDIIRSYSLGACTYITKPCGQKEFSTFASVFSAYWARIAKIPLSAQ
jgi:CheY-like chemotaxis protein